MLDLAYKHEEQIRLNMLDTWYDEKYMYYHASPYHELYQTPSPNDGDWNCRQFVSLDRDGNLLGLITYSINREDDLVNNFGAINFSNNKIVFAKDLAKVIDDIFCKFNIRKMEFFVIVGNPIEKNYDRLITLYGGKIIGIKTKHYKLMDGNYYDKKIYELFREDYIAAKEKTHGK